MTGDLHSLTGAYVAHALDPDEAELFERHLADCPECSQEVAQLVETSARLGKAVAMAAPLQLRGRVLAQVSRTPQLAPAGRAKRLGVSRRGSLARPQWLLAVAATFAMVAAGLGVVTVQLYDELREARQIDAQLTSVLTAPDARTASAASGTVRGTVIVSRDRAQLAFLPVGLTDVPEDRTYQLWLVGPGDPRSAGLLQTDGAESRPHITAAQGEFEAVALTVEPAGGSRQPTTRPVLVVGVPPAS